MRESQRAHARGSARSVFRRASDFAPPHFGTPLFPREFVGCSVPDVLPTHRRVGCRSVLRYGNHIFALVAKDLERFVEDGTQIGQFHLSQ